jgi:hypothetical protein
VNDALIRDGVDAAMLYLKLRLGSFLVAGGNRLLYILDGGAQFRTLTGVMGAAIFCLAGAFLGGGYIGH